MKKIVIVLSIAIITLIVMSCTQNKQQVASIQSTQPKSESEKVKGNDKKQIWYIYNHNPKGRKWRNKRCKSRHDNFCCSPL